MFFVSKSYTHLNLVFVGGFVGIDKWVRELLGDEKKIL